MVAFLSEIRPLINSPTPGTPAHDDLHYIKGHHRSGDLLGLRWWAERSAALSLNAADEHLAGLRAILAAEDLLPLPAMALVRSIYDAAIQTCWLFDVQEPTEVRLARWAGRLLHDTQESPRALAGLGGSGHEREKADVEEARELAQALMAKSGFELKAKGGDRSSETANVTFKGHKTSLMPVIDHIVPRFTPNQTGVWTMYSGAVHSYGWFVAGLLGDEAEIVTSIIAPLLDTCDALTIEFARYFGIPARPTATATHRRRVAVLQHARPNLNPGAGVDLYRAAGGAPPLPD